MAVGAGRQWGLIVQVCVALEEEGEVLQLVVEAFDGVAVVEVAVVRDRDESGAHCTSGVVRCRVGITVLQRSVRLRMLVLRACVLTVAVVEYAPAHA